MEEAHVPINSGWDTLISAAAAAACSLERKEGDILHASAIYILSFLFFEFSHDLFFLFCLSSSTSPSFIHIVWFVL